MSAKTLMNKIQSLALVSCSSVECGASKCTPIQEEPDEDIQPAAEEEPGIRMVLYGPCITSSSVLFRCIISGTQSRVIPVYNELRCQYKKKRENRKLTG